MLRGALLATLLSLIAACATLPGTPDWFPVQSGTRWTYRITQQVGDRPPVVTTLSVLERPAEVHAGERFAVRRGDSATDYLFLTGEDAVIRAGRRGPYDLQPRWALVPQAVLRLPLRKGDQWQRATGLMLFSDRAPEGSDGEAELTVTVADTDATVSVPAGRFEHTVRVSTDAVVDWAQGPDTPAVNVISDEWYADGVGLVKLVREEREIAEIGRSGRIEVELIDIERPKREAAP